MIQCLLFVPFSFRDIFKNIVLTFLKESVHIDSQCVIYLSYKLMINGIPFYSSRYILINYQ